ncbi:MAG: proline--tRNA ligase [Sedimentisphaerales bacterium]|nr:proline--tRNA ligase [Sedimentisphaerales bacterium]
MRYSRILVPTIKEVPADAEIISHQLLLRAGMMRKIASGTYTYLILGWRSLLKIIAIIREEMNATGAQEIMMPSLQPMELWQQTGRNIDYGETMCHLTDRHGRENVLGPTAEEVMTFLVAGEISSYKQLPINLYQISPKFRDEFRPRFGPIRSREFIMKDAYSFHSSPESLEETYRAMYDAYCRIFTRCGLEYVIVEAEVGEMGGSGSHQFTIPCESGEDTIVYAEDGSYAANLERANVDPLSRNDGQGVKGVPPVEEVHTPHIGSIEAVCDFLKTKPAQMIKTLIYSKDGKTIAALIRGDHEANEEKLKIAAGGGKLELADEITIEKATHAKIGFAGPVGLAERVDKMIIDHAAATMAVGITGANKTDYHIKNVVPGRDFPLNGDNIIVADIRNACEGDTYNGRKLLFKKGIEVGQVFKLGTKYSEKLGAKYLDENNSEKSCLMGCYGIGVNRILASAIELNNDKDGIIWPINIAPFEVIVTCTNQDDEEVAQAAENIYSILLKNNIDALLDDRILRAGAKFKDADLIGIPIRITVGKKSVAEGNVEIKLRRESESVKVKIEDALVRVTELINKLRS